MKKRILLMAGSALILASCDSSGNNILQTQQARIDSVARVKATLQDAINQKKNDSTINAMAAAKADSIQKAVATITEQTAAAAKPAPKDTTAHKGK